MSKELTKKIWETRERRRENGSIQLEMICQNSKPELSKWSDFVPEDGICNEWVKVGPEVTAVLCSSCTARSVNF